MFGFKGIGDYERGVARQVRVAPLFFRAYFERRLPCVVLFADVFDLHVLVFYGCFVLDFSLFVFAL